MALLYLWRINVVISALPCLAPVQQDIRLCLALNELAVLHLLTLACYSVV